MNCLKKCYLISALVLLGCSANNASVKTTTSPIDGKTRTVINGSDFSISYIYPASGEGLGVKIAGGSVVDNQVASIVFDAHSSSGFREAFFKADGDIYKLRPTAALTDFQTSEYGTRAIKEYTIPCADLVKVSNSTEVYLRITYADGFVDYDVSKSKYGADGFGMIKKITDYCK